MCCHSVHCTLKDIASNLNHQALPTQPMQLSFSLSSYLPLCSKDLWMPQILFLVWNLFNINFHFPLPLCLFYDHFTHSLSLLSLSLWSEPWLRSKAVAELHSNTILYWSQIYDNIFFGFITPCCLFLFAASFPPNFLLSQNIEHQHVCLSEDRWQDAWLSFPITAHQWMQHGSPITAPTVCEVGV